MLTQQSRQGCYKEYLNTVDASKSNYRLMKKQKATKVKQGIGNKVILTKIQNLVEAIKIS